MIVGHSSLDIIQTYNDLNEEELLGLEMSAVDTKKSPQFLRVSFETILVACGS